jgi:hypothetical protein
MKLIALLISGAVLAGGTFSAQCQTTKRMNYTGQWVSDGEHQDAPSAREGYSKDSGATRRRSSDRDHYRWTSPRTNEVVKAYGVSRYVDAGDGRIMHERHAVYRLEESPDWKLQPSNNQPEVLLGPILGLRKAEYAPEPLRGEVGRDLMATKQNTQTAVDGVRAVTQDQIKIREDLAQSLKRLNQNEATLAQELTELKQRVDASTNKSQNSSKENNQPKATSESTPAPASLSAR